MLEESFYMLMISQIPVFLVLQPVEKVWSMIHDGIKLKNNVLERLFDLIRVVKQHFHIEALCSFGSVAKKELKPLSDLDFAVLLSGQLNRSQRFKNILS